MPSASAPHSSVALQTYRNRHAEMVRGGWIYYPERALYVEKVSTRSKRYTPHGESQFLPQPRRVYAREVMQIPETMWRQYVEGHPLAVLAVDAWIGHPALAKRPCEALIDPDAFAVETDGRHGRSVR